MSKIMDHYFIKEMQNQKIELDNIQLKNLYLSINSY